MIKSYEHVSTFTLIIIAVAGRAAASLWRVPTFICCLVTVIYKIKSIGLLTR